VPAGATPVDFVSGPFLDVTNHLLVCVGYRPVTGDDAFGFAAVLDLTTQTVLLTVPASVFGPPTFGGVGQGSFAALTILHLNRAAPKHSRIVAVVTGQGNDEASGFHSSQSLSVIDGEGTIIMNQVSPFSEVSGVIFPNQPFFPGSGSRRHIMWSRGTGTPLDVSMTDVFGKQTVGLGVSTQDGDGVWHPAVDPQVTFIRPDFALRNANLAAPYFVTWWDKKTGAILLSNPLTDAMLQTEDPELKGKKKLKALPADVTASGFSYHVVEQSRLFPYLSDRKNP